MDFSPWLEALRTAPTAPGKTTRQSSSNIPLTWILDAKAAADRLAREVSKAGIYSLQFVVGLMTTEIL